MKTDTAPIMLTDTAGQKMPDIEDFTEPNMGSIVLDYGLWGTAWQRHFSDGKWHSTRGGTPRSWNQLLRKRNLVLVYDAEVRP